MATQFGSKYGQTVDEGITDLQKAIELKPDYDDAMAYLNLLYRQKADMETSADARDADLKNADDLVDKVKAIKQKKMENSAADFVVLSLMNGMEAGGFRLPPAFFFRPVPIGERLHGRQKGILYVPVSGC